MIALRSSQCSSANSLDGAAIRSLNRWGARSRLKRPASSRWSKLESAHVDAVAAALHRPAVGAVLQFHGAGAVRLSVFLLVPAGVGADQLSADLAGLPQPHARRSSVNSVSSIPGKASSWPIRSTGLLFR